MGRDEHRSPAALLAQVIDERLLRLAVHGGEAVIEDEHPRGSRQGARNARPLSLTPGERDAPLAYEGLCALGEDGDFIFEGGPQDELLDPLITELVVRSEPDVLIKGL